MMSTDAPSVTFSTLNISVYGSPTPQGSKKVVGGKNGRAAILLDVNRDQLHTWRDDVMQAGVRAVEECPSWDREAQAVLGAFTFTMRRPLNHYVSGDTARDLKTTAPRLHVTRPDLDKLLRSTWDALTSAGVIHDDCRLAQVFASKVYLDPTGLADLDRPGVKIALTAVKP